MAEKHENIEDFFRKAIAQSETQIPFNESHWQQMQSMLQAEMPVPSSAGKGYYIFSNVISLLVGVVFFWAWFIGTPTDAIPANSNSGPSTQIKEKQSEQEYQETSAVEETPTVSPQVIEHETGAQANQQEPAPKAVKTVDSSVASQTQVLKRDLLDENTGQSEETQNPKEDQVKSITANARQSESSAQFADQIADEKEVSGLPTRAYLSLQMRDVTSPDVTLLLPDELPFQAVYEPDGGGSESSNGPIFNSKGNGGFSRFSVGLALAPDFSSNEVFQYNRLGRYFGVVAEYWLTPRWAVSVGAYNTTKRYLVGGEEYNSPAGFWGNVTNGELPNKIDANCRVIDIPINLKYKILSLPSLNIAASVGASSYIMLEETYKYELDNWESEWSTSNENQHFFGVGNLQLHIEKRLGKHFAIEAAPFFKMPLTGYGHGNIRFHSMGSLFTLRKYFFHR